MLTRELARPRGPTPTNPRGFTLLEMVVVLVLSAIVLGIVTAIGNRLQHQLHDTTQRIEIAEELSTASAILPLELRSLAPADGDVRGGEARDSSLEMRSTVAAAVACGGAPGALLVAPFRLAGGRHAAWSVQAGDTLWLLTSSDSTERWRALPIHDIHPARASCPALTGDAASSVFDLGSLVTIEVSDSTAAVPGTPLRVTRPIRYSIYRGSDGLWYLGVRSWSAATAQFNGIQPLSGPYTPPGPTGSHIEYFDVDGDRVSSGAPDTRGIARIEWLLRSPPRADAQLADSSRLVVAMRNR